MIFLKTTAESGSNIYYVRNYQHVIIRYKVEKVML